MESCASNSACGVWSFDTTSSSCKLYNAGAAGSSWDLLKSWKRFFFDLAFLRCFEILFLLQVISRCHRGSSWSIIAFWPSFAQVLPPRRTISFQGHPFARRDGDSWTYLKSVGVCSFQSHQNRRRKLRAFLVDHPVTAVCVPCWLQLSGSFWSSLPTRFGSCHRHRIDLVTVCFSVNSVHVHVGSMQSIWFPNAPMLSEDAKPTVT